MRRDQEDLTENVCGGVFLADQIQKFSEVFLLAPKPHYPAPDCRNPEEAVWLVLVAHQALAIPQDPLLAREGGLQVFLAQSQHIGTDIPLVGQEEVWINSKGLLAKQTLPANKDPHNHTDQGIFYKTKGPGTLIMELELWGNFSAPWAFRFWSGVIPLLD